MYRLKETWIFLGVVAVLLAAAVLAFHLPQQRRLDEIRTEITTQNRQLEADTSKATAVPELSRRVEQMRKKYHDFDQRLPKSRELFGFLEQIGQRLHAAELDSQSIEPGKPRQQELFHTLPIIMRCRGGYAELTKFLCDMQRSERLTRVQRLDLAYQPTDRALDIEVHMNIYFTEQ
jgi:Tfp pilus assembly protein PilO